MGRAVNQLTVRGITGMKEEGRYADGAGLYLIVDRHGSKRWMFFYKVQGKRREMGLGGLTSVPLAEAREKAKAARELMAQGHDPLSARHTEPLPEPESAITFGAFADQLVEDLKPGWRGLKTEASWVRSFTQHGAALRNRPIDEVSTDDVKGVLDPIWMTKPESAKKLAQRIEVALDAAKVKGLRTGDNPARWRGHLALILPRQPKLVRGHHPALPYDQAPSLMRRLSRSRGISARALEFAMLTASREAMVLGATWGEVEGDVWVIPGARMKGGRPHRVPLSSEAEAVLASVRPPHAVKGDQLIFPNSTTGGQLSNMAMDMLMRDLVPGFVPHGLRSTFRDWVGDRTEFAREVAEEALAHIVGDEAERAYRRADALEKRRRLMQAWGSFCSEGTPQAPSEGRGCSRRF